MDISALQSRIEALWQGREKVTPATGSRSLPVAGFCPAQPIAASTSRPVCATK